MSLKENKKTNQVMFYPNQSKVLGDGTKTIKFSNKCP